jgi:hypothetical protein
VNDREVATSGGVPFDPSSRISMGHYLRTDEYLVSPNGSFFAIMQNDGNFTVNHGTGPGDNRGNIWHTELTGAGREFFAIMQADGNFVVYFGTGPADNRGCLWHAESARGAGPFYTLVLNDDARLQIVIGDASVTWENDMTASPGPNYRLDQDAGKQAGVITAGDSWQSFTPAFDGYLYRVDLFCTPYSPDRYDLRPSVPATLSLYDGEGIDDDGWLGDQDIVVAQQAPPQRAWIDHPQQFLFPIAAPIRGARLRGGERYTIRLRPREDVDVSVTPDGAYRRGQLVRFYNREWRAQPHCFAFRTYLRPIPPTWDQLL